MGTADYDALLDNLRQLTSAPGHADFTRPNLIALLEVLTTHLGEALTSKLGELEDGTHVEAQHAVADLLSGLCSALRDLDNGLTDPVLRRSFPAALQQLVRSPSRPARASSASQASWKLSFAT